MVNARAELLELARGAAADVPDPEIPGLSIADLGILRSVDESDGCVVVTITPTYSGCPAMHKIERDIDEALHSVGITKFRIERELIPAWTTESITESGRRKLHDSGIAPPNPLTHNYQVVVDITLPSVTCPICGSTKSTVTSEFGSTPCKAFYHCEDCLSTFEYFKPI